jgi:hypothetical protein
MRKRAAAIGLALVAVAVVAFVQLRGASEPPLEAIAEPGHFRSPPFLVTVSGPLWQSRTLRDTDGTKDFALVDGDLPVDVRVRSIGAAGVATVELRVDGRSQRSVRTACGEGGCPAQAAVKFVARLRGLPAGRHAVDIYAASSADRGTHRRASFEIRTIGRAPAAIEGRPARRDAAAVPPSGDVQQLQQTALGVLAGERTRPGLAAALGNARLNVIQAGPLNAHGRRLGATLWLALATPLRDVRATVPGYVPSAAAAGGYTRQRINMHVAILRDALVDIDLTTRRVIAFEPGPRSHVLSWKPSRAPAPAGAQDED